jgi:hypothetical protein
MQKLVYAVKVHLIVAFANIEAYTLQGYIATIKCYLPQLFPANADIPV